jgi:hypothetical protein
MVNGAIPVFAFIETLPKILGNGRVGLLNGPERVKFSGKFPDKIVKLLAPTQESAILQGSPFSIFAKEPDGVFQSIAIMIFSDSIKS